MRNLFITSTRIGDAVLSTAILSRLMELEPAAQWTIACGPAAAGLFEAMPNLERIIIMRKKKYGLHWVELWLKCADVRWNRVVDLRRSALPYFLWAKSRKIIASPDPALHRVDDLARQFGFNPVPAPKLWSGQKNKQQAASLVPGLGAVKLLCVSPAANWGGKIWPVENFAELIKRLTGANGILAGAKIALFGAPEEKPHIEKLKEMLPGLDVADLSGKADLATCHEIFRNASLFIGNDSGLMHIAAASGAPTLGLFGPSKPEQYGPRGKSAAYTSAVRTDKTYEELVFDKSFDYTSQKSLMESLSVDKAEAAVRKLWMQAGGEKAA